MWINFCCEFQSVARKATRSRSKRSALGMTVLAEQPREHSGNSLNNSAVCLTNRADGRASQYRDCNKDLSISCPLPRAIFDDRHCHIWLTWETLRIAVDQTRL